MWRSVVLPLTVLLTLAVLVLTVVPLGVPGEWVWPRQASPQDMAEALDRLIMPLIVAGLLVGFSRFVDLRISHFSRVIQAACLCGLVIGAFVWLNAVRQAAASPQRELRPLWVLYDKYASGYFFESVFVTKSAKELLNTYESRVSKGDYLHEGTHPPGLFLLNWWAVQLTSNSERLIEFALWTQSAESIRLFRNVEAEAQLARPLTRSELAALCLVSFSSSWLWALTVVPVYGIVTVISDRRVAWRAACVVITVPAIAVFAPRSDIIYAFTGSGMLWLIVKSLLTTSMVERIVVAVLAGTVTFVSLTISLAHLPVLAAGGLFGVFLFFAPFGNDRKRIVAASGIQILAFVACVLAWGAITDCHLVRIWPMNLANHAAFYGHATRTWWKWLFVNQVELSFSVGLPLAVVSLAAVWNIVKSMREQSAGSTAEENSPTFQTGQGASAVRVQLCWALMLIWALLWISGKNMGEAARLWCFLMPWFVIVASGFFTPPGVRGQVGRFIGHQGLHGKTDLPYYADSWLALLIAQYLVCIITTGQVSGYLEFSVL